MVARADNENFVMLTEEPRESLDPMEPFKYQMAFCSAGLHDGMNSRQVWEWVEYHRVIHSIDHFFFYDSGGIDKPMRETFQKHIEERVVSITDLRESLLFSVKLWGQPLAIADCIHRNRYSTKWLFMGDVDEYLHIPSNLNLVQILSRYSEAPWFTFGSLSFDPKFCEKRKNVDQFVIDLVRFAEKNISCTTKRQKEEFCLGVFGHRKYILDPRKVDIASTHKIFELVDKGVDLNAKTELRNYHYRGLGSNWKSENICSRSLGEHKNIDNRFVQNRDMENISLKIRDSLL